jgi:hypothetical protein
MPDTYCRKCGTLAQPGELFCRACGFSLDSPPIAIEATGIVKPENVQQGLAGGKLKRLTPTTWLIIAVGVLLFALAYVVGLDISQASQLMGKPVIAIEIVGTSTPYPTRAAYRTATPYNENSTPYPTHAYYPTTGDLATAIPTQPSTGLHVITPYRFRSFTDSCRLIVNDQYDDLDSIVILVDKSTNLIMTSVYVRARDSFSTSGIPTGTYDVYVALGQGWDAATRLFTNNASYYRFQEPTTFDTCNSIALYSGYQYLTITLNTKEGAGSDIVNLLPGGFPGFIP